ncbi:MAG: glycosyltransferase family 4 protein [Deltaproteobacteria bacterium]|nr:glycosyltransferase family 4 protein [Deltaproteobacteria bacterium]
MKICYLLEGTDLWGGVKVVLEQANELYRRGVDVVVLSKGPEPDWFEVESPFVHVPAFTREVIPSSDYIIATFWETVAPAVESARGRVVHFCQGFEADYAVNRHLAPQIDRVYRLPTWKITVSPHLVELISNRFGQFAVCIGQTFDNTLFYPEDRRPFPAVPTVILVGIYEADFKGIPFALQALDMVREKGLVFRLLRVSQLPQSEEERRYGFEGNYYVNVRPEVISRLYRSSHLAVSPSLEAEGFGLPALEALACGLPSVLTEISSFRGFDSRSDFALFVPPSSPEPMAAAVIRLMRDPDLRRRLSARAVEAARNHSTEKTVSRLLSLLESGEDGAGLRASL